MKQNCSNLLKRIQTIQNKLQLIHSENGEKQIKIITRSPEQYQNLESFLENYTVEEDLGDRTLEDFQNCCVVFDDMLDSNQKLIDPFFTRGRHNDLDVYYLSQSYFDLPKRTIRNNSNTKILFQQTLKDVGNIYRDIAGFDMSLDEFKSLCREAWKEKQNCLEINRLEDKNGKKYKICNESNMKCKIFNPATDPFQESKVRSDRRFRGAKQASDGRFRGAKQASDVDLL